MSVEVGGIEPPCSNILAIASTHIACSFNFFHSGSYKHDTDGISPMISLFLRGDQNSQPKSADTILSGSEWAGELRMVTQPRRTRTQECSPQLRFGRLFTQPTCQLRCAANYLAYRIDTSSPPFVKERNDTVFSALRRFSLRLYYSTLRGKIKLLR